MTRYTFDEVREALAQGWGLRLYRGGDLTDLGRDGRFDTAYSKTGFVVGGQLPGEGYGYRHFKTLARVVHVSELEKDIEKIRRASSKGKGRRP